MTMIFFGIGFLSRLGGEKSHGFLKTEKFPRKEVTTFMEKTEDGLG